MTNQLPINGNQAKAGSAGAGHALALGRRVARCRPASDHHKFQRATPASRKLAGAMTRSGPFIRLGWCFTQPHDFLEVDRLTKAGAESRVAAQLITDHSGAQSHFQGISERHVHSTISTSARSTNASTTSRKRFADEQNPCVSGAKSD